MLKRLVNLAGSTLVWAVDSVGDSVNRIVGKSSGPKCVVLAYHSVTQQQRPLFAKQMDVLLRKSEPVHADVHTLPAGGGRYAAMTFDDGLENILVNALPELEKRRIPCTLFIVTDMLGQERSWEHMGGEDVGETGVMSAEQLRALRSEFVRIGSHTMTHPFLPSTEKAKVRRELSESRSKLQALVNQEVTLFSFPYGAFNQSVIQDCREAEYARVFTALPTFAFAQPGEFVTGRVGVTPSDWPVEFRLKLAGAYRWLPWAYSLKRRIRTTLRGGSAAPAGKNSAEQRTA
jgi:peptidoglycan/xylan/chitin deacetylase (PgdA/CDA1 family)